ncbi:M57 family metalloprotease [Secundilactobacillus folii]|uniref:Matrixin family metalloprotease n=1 Tax=Secundilactobacillus folii TaxID=2678357 RepID=A0A7X3C2U4_9LACO|nr:M57 family metalloprotease [Secundilactobacillus folii]MTV82212.1 matrixin family metalloprotease [Secundilactobacillus folii]
MKKLGIIAVTAVSMLAVLVASPTAATPNAQAKTKVTVAWKKSMPTTKYQINSAKAKHAYAYSSNLKKKVFKLSNYSRTTFYAKGHEAVKVGKKTRVYYYIKSSSNSKKAGWVWRGYLMTPIASKTALMAMINADQDLNPTGEIMSQPSAFYSRYRATLRKEFNMTGNLTHFTNHQARVYIADPSLKTWATKAMSVWNDALGRKVFITGTAGNKDLTITTKASSEWDGLNDGVTLDLSSTAIKDNTYVESVADTPMIRDLYNQYEDVANAYKAAPSGSADKANYLSQGHKLYNQLVAAQKAAAPSVNEYWESVLVHELGHSLGLDHTPYLTDIMYAETSDDGFSASVNGKYTWDAPKDPNDTRRESPTLSDRDVNRAKLAMKLGYW